MRNGEGRLGDLTPACKRALVILLSNPLFRHRSGWRDNDENLVRQETIEALYERYLVKIVVESRHRRRHTAKLTEVGEYAAREIGRQFSLPEKQGVSEKVGQFICEITS